MATESTEIAPKRAYLVGIQHIDDTPELASELLEELKELSDTLGLEFAGCEMARLREHHAGLITGTGKTREIIQNAKKIQADVIVIDDFLTPSQQRNWENMSGELSVIDRQEVILDIFASRAQTTEACLQVELARASYSLPRLKHKWLHLGRQRGATGGLGGRMGGEQQLELDSRVIRKRMTWLKEQLADVRRHRDIQRKQRLQKPVPVVAIVGYTNAGKSSLLNCLTKAGILVENKLFATLDPTVRRYRLPSGQDILLADTVGFIRKLPHLLVESFKSTLEETRLADYIVEVIDGTSPSWRQHHETTLTVLREIGAGDKTVLTVFNKMDLIPPETRQYFAQEWPQAVMISATNHENIDDLVARLEAMASADAIFTQFLIPHSQYSVLSDVRKYGFILKEDYLEDGIHVDAKIPPAHLHRWKDYAIDTIDQ